MEIYFKNLNIYTKCINADSNNCIAINEEGKSYHQVRIYLRRNKQTVIEQAETIDYCMENGIFEKVLRENCTEVLDMLLEEFDVKNMK